MIDNNISIFFMVALKNTNTVLFIYIQINCVCYVNYISIFPFSQKYTNINLFII